MSFADLKKSRKSSMDKLIQAAEKAGGNATETKSYGDDRIWKPTRDKSGNGYAVIRFLPAKEGEDLPWVRFWDHGFQGPTGQWYIEKSLTTLGQEDPVSKLNSKLWNSGHEEDKEVARKQKRRLHYVSNILVVSDPANPENEGKVMLYQYGKKIFDKIMDVMNPEFEDEDSMNPFDFWEGADFKIKIRKVEGWVNYDKSEFASPSALFDSNEDKLESVYNKLHSLQEFIDPSNFKTYAELEAKLERVLGGTAPSTTAEMIAREEVVEAVQERSAPPRQPAKTSYDDDDDTLNYFAGLAAQD
jgi:hypothetical protein